LVASSSKASSAAMKYDASTELTTNIYKSVSDGGSDWFTFFSHNFFSGDTEHRQVTNRNVDKSTNKPSRNHSIVGTWLNTLKGCILQQFNSPADGWEWWVIGGYFVTLVAVRVCEWVQIQAALMLSNITSASVFVKATHTISPSFNVWPQVLTLIFINISCIFLAPFWEELLYRGYVLPLFSRVMPVRRAAVLSSLLFAGHHGDMKILLPLFAMSLVWTEMYLATNSLFVSMMVHSLWNCRTLVYRLQRLLWS
jgi:membrane protease YdiL (CAAX protease family)